MSGKAGEKIGYRPISGVHQEGMIPAVNDVPTGDFLDLREVHHHPVGGVTVLFNDFAGKRDLDGVTVPVQVPALALVVRNAVAGIEFQAAGDKHREAGGGDRERGGLYNGPMLTIEDHSRDSAGMTYIYPVVSRRAGGVSLGVNLNTNNACNWACAYCQVEGLTRGGPLPVDLVRLRDELDRFLGGFEEFLSRNVPAEARRLVDVAFSGNGEPTSAEEFPQAVAIVREALGRFGLAQSVKIRLITNGSLLHRSRVQAGIRSIGEAGGEVWFKLDRVGEEATRAVNGAPVSPEKAGRNLETCAGLAPTWVQTCWFAVDGRLPAASEVDDYCRLLQPLASKLAGIHFYGLARPSMQPGAERLGRIDAAELEKLAGEIQKKTGIRVLVSP